MNTLVRGVLRRATFCKAERKELLLALFYQTNRAAATISMHFAGGGGILSTPAAGNTQPSDFSSQSPSSKQIIFHVTVTTFH